MKKIFLFLILSLSIWAPPTWAVTLYKELENWSVHIDESLGNGCFAIAEYSGGTSFRIGFNNLDEELGVYVLFGNESWTSLEEGKKYRISIQFGEKERWTGTATGFKFESSDQMTWLKLPISSDQDGRVLFFREFMEERGMRLFYGEDQIDNLTLRGTFVAGTITVECQKEMLNQSPTSQSDPFKNDAPATSKDPFR